MPDNDQTHPPFVTCSDAHESDFCVAHRYRLRFTRDAFNPASTVLAQVLPPPGDGPHAVLVCVDEGVLAAWPDLKERIAAYFAANSSLVRLAGNFVRVPGGEAAKNDPAVFDQVLRAVHDAGICRRSFVLGIGGGAVLDVVGYAAATAHRGVRLIRMPTTTLAQADAGIGVKNGVNAFGKKNFLGTFAVPWAVINDETFLQTLSDRDWRCGLSEAVKVGLVKDAAFFDEIEAAAPLLRKREASTAGPIIQRCAHLHLSHIVDGGDPFELTEARPLDFGHWAAHKLEQMTDWHLPHGEAVAIGIALDVTYAAITGMLGQQEAERILACLEALGFGLFDGAMEDDAVLLKGLEEFREHLGGVLTVPLLDRIGRGVDVNEIDQQRMKAAIARLRARAESHR